MTLEDIRKAKYVFSKLRHVTYKGHRVKKVNGTLIVPCISTLNGMYYTDERTMVENSDKKYITASYWISDDLKEIKKIES